MFDSDPEYQDLDNSNTNQYDRLPDIGNRFMHLLCLFDNNESHDFQKFFTGSG